MFRINFRFGSEFFFIRTHSRSRGGGTRTISQTPLPPCGHFTPLLSLKSKLICLKSEQTNNYDVPRTGSQYYGFKYVAMPIRIIDLHQLPCGSGSRREKKIGLKCTKMSYSSYFRESLHLRLGDKLDTETTVQVILLSGRFEPTQNIGRWNQRFEANPHGSVIRLPRESDLLLYF